MIIRYDPRYGVAIPDAVVAEFVDLAVANPSDFSGLTVSSELVIHEVRARIKEGTINQADVQIEYNGQVIPVDENGRIDTWPDGFCDGMDKVLNRLLGVSPEEEKYLMSEVFQALHAPEVYPEDEDMDI